MVDMVERTIGGLRVVIDRQVCVGFAQCVDVSEVAFQLDDEEMAEFGAPESVSRESLIDACRACPVEALRIFDAGGVQLVP
jgi:ferredoxin